MNINFAPNTKEKSFILNGGAEELLSLAEQYLAEVDSISLSLYKGYVFSFAHQGKVDVFTSVEKLERKLLFVEQLDDVYIELITKRQQYVLTRECTVSSSDNNLIKQIPLAELKALFLAGEFGGWIDGENRKENWVTMSEGKGSFRTVIVLFRCTVTFNCYMRAGKINSATIRIKKRRSRR